MDKKSAVSLSNWLNDIFCIIKKEDRNVLAIVAKSWGSETQFDVHIIDTIAEIARVTISECEILTESELHS